MPYCNRLNISVQNINNYCSNYDTKYIKNKVVLYQFWSPLAKHTIHKIIIHYTVIFLDICDRKYNQKSIGKKLYYKKCVFLSNFGHP